MFCSRKTNKSPVSGGKRLQMHGMASISTGLNKIKLRRLLRFQWTIDQLRKRGALFAGADRKKETVEELIQRDKDTSEKAVAYAC